LPQRDLRSRPKHLEAISISVSCTVDQSHFQLLAAAGVGLVLVILRWIGFFLRFVESLWLLALGMTEEAHVLRCNLGLRLLLGGTLGFVLQVA